MDALKQDLEHILEEKNIKIIDKNSEHDITVISELYDLGFISAVKHEPHSGVQYHNVKISGRGREWLEARVDSNNWYKSFSNRIAVLSVIVAIITLFFTIEI